MRQALLPAGDIVALPEGQQRTLLGSDAFRLVNLASGIDPRAVVPRSRAKSISSETTLPKMCQIMKRWQL